MDPRLRTPPMDGVERKVKYMSDYVLDEVHVQGRKKPKRVPRYIGPYFEFEYPNEVVARWKKIYLYCTMAMIALLLIPMSFNSNVVEAWYVTIGQIVVVGALYFAVKMTWILNRLGFRLKRREADRIDSQIPLSMTFLAIGFGISAVGGVVWMVINSTVTFPDVAATAVSAVACADAIFLLVSNGKLDTYQVDGEPEL